MAGQRALEIKIRNSKTELVRKGAEGRSVMMQNNIFDLFDLISKDKQTKDASPVSWLVVGLGNPGKEYVYTRHNAGFTAIDYIARELGVSVTKSGYQSLYSDCSLAGKRILLMKPQTFMNNSGIAVREAASFYKIAPENILVIYDDISLDIGKIRIRRKGSDGGHNGIKSIIYHLQSDAFPRIKIGVGKKPHPDYDLADWVLSNIPEADRKDLLKAVGNSYDSARLVLGGETEKAMQLYN